MTRALLALAVAAALSATAAADTPDPRRRVALVEFRSGSSALPQVERRAGHILDRMTSLAVVGADEARRRYGSALDSDVVACAGEAACIARIGRKLEVDEVLLIGVSEFGDVILTLQRIDTRSGQVAARIAEALAPDTSPDDPQLTRYLERLLPRSDFVRWGVIQIDADVDGATVMVGTEVRGTTPLKPQRVRAPASYDIVLSKSGYNDFRASVDVPPDAIVKVQPTLSRDSDAWYQKWWVAAIAGTVVVGAATVGYFALQDDPSDLPLVGPPL
jgi:hypothetical protein